MLKCRYRLGAGTRTAFILALLFGLSAVPGHAQLAIGGYHLQSSTRVSTYAYNYSYTADVVNQGLAKQGVTGTVTSTSPNTVVVQNSVHFGSVPAQQTVTSTDTFTIQQDRRYPFNPGSLQWNLQGSVALTPGTVAATGNPQVALYTVSLPAAGSVTVRFGPTTSYGRQTWTQSRTSAGPVAIQVAGMLANTAYHLQAAVSFADGETAVDADHTFTTGQPSDVPGLTASTTQGMTPQPGVEEITFATGTYTGVVVSDLAGRPLWTYRFLPGNVGEQVDAVKLLPNGHFLLTVAQGSGFPLQNQPTIPGAVVALREIDLAGNVIHDLTMAELNDRMKAAGYPQQLQQFHHDFALLPNGHILILSNTVRSFTGLIGYPGTTKVLADTVVDLDQNLQPVWVWDEFDHLDVNRHPYMFPDLTHSNAVIYSPTDGNIIVSMRHQNWVVKVDYRNGTGTGGILWRLGYQGDFKLLNGTDPTDWQYAQHYPSLFTPQSAGVFSLGLMDNGDDRVFATGTACGVVGNPPCNYTTIPVFQIDESAKTAKVLFHQILPANLYSFFGGNTDLLANGNIEYGLSSTTPTSDSDIYEVTPTSNPQTVWHLHASKENLYRGYRIPSLYPGVLWQ